MVRVPQLLSSILIAVVQSKNVTRSYGNSSILWRSCGHLANRNLECTTIHVPLNQWAPESSSKSFSIPLVRMMMNDTRAETILLNPGGPGGSGIDFLNRWGPALDKIFDGHFHLLGFDPRAVAGSKPQANCVPESQREDARVSAMTKITGGPLDASEDYTLTVKANSGDFHAAESNHALLCNQTLGEYMSYINTPQTAADMNDILDAIGARKLNYFGGSYGTLLGATYAQLFPDRVRRVALNGVIDFTAYWSRYNPAETTEIDDCWQGMLEHCLNERANCPLAEGFTNASDLRAALEHKIDAMDEDPINIFFNSSAYGIFRGADVRGSGIFGRMYTPSRWPVLASSLAYLLRGDYYTPYLDFFGGIDPADPRKKHSTDPMTGDTEADSPDAFNIITRGDQSPRDQLTRKKLTRKQLKDKYVPYPGYANRDIGNRDSFRAEVWAIPRSHDLVPKKKVKTAYPILLMSSAADPVTPLRAAKAVNAVFEDSVLIVKDSIGHTTLSKPSNCTLGHLKRYFVEGILPEVGTICRPDHPEYFSTSANGDSKTKSDQETFDLERAMERLAEYPETIAAGHLGRI